MMDVGGPHRDSSYTTRALDAINGTAVPSLLADRPAVVLERIARGGGATRWFRIGDRVELELLAERLKPGSSVSFYFDERLRWQRFNKAAADALIEIATVDRDAVLGRSTPGKIEIVVDYISGRDELDEFTSDLDPNESVLVGRFPAADNDGRDAITINLPDADGVTRAPPALTTSSTSTAPRRGRWPGAGDRHGDLTTVSRPFESATLTRCC
jgi:hypothetical protein